MSSIEKTFTNDEIYQKIVNLYGADFVEKYYSVFEKVYSLIDIPNYNIEEVQKNKLFSDAIKEYIAVNNIHNLEEIERIVENDFLKHKGPELFRVLLKAGDVLVFYPEDVHMPGLQVEKSEPAKKVVFKIDVNLL